MKFPTDDDRTMWTRHIKNKMMYYGLSEARIRRVVKSPKRVQEGVAEETVAVMQPTPSKKKPEEIWVMYKPMEHKKVKFITRPQLLMISAWRYPGVSKPGNEIPIPDNIRDELADFFRGGV